MLNAAIAAQGRVGLMLNVLKEAISPTSSTSFPRSTRPPVSQLRDAEWVAVNTILEET